MSCEAVKTVVVGLPASEVGELVCERGNTNQDEGMDREGVA